MRPSQKQNRARGRGNRKPNGNMVNRVFESAGPEGKVRGTPQQIVDKYLALARDSQTSGDRVMSENFLQHAEHYQRILLDAQGVRDDRRDPRGQDQDGQDGQDDSRDGDDSDDNEEQAARQDDSRRDDNRRDDNRRDDNRRDDNRRDDNRRDDNRRDDRPAAQGGGQSGDQSSGQSGGQNAEETGQPDGARRGNRRGPNRRRETEVSGLTTIDSGPEEGESLLVEADELSASQPPRRRRAPRRDRAEESDQGTDQTGAGSQND